MASITTRAGKGAPLTHAEVDANFTGLNSELSLKYDASNPSGFISGNQTISITGDATGSGTTSIPLTLASTGVTAGSYTAANITVGADGRITAVSSSTGASFDQNLNTTDSVTFAGLTVNSTITGSISGNAATATSASQIDSVDFRNGNSGSGANPDTINVNGTGYVTSVSLFGQTDGALYSQAYSTSWVHQIFGDYRTGQLAVRGRNNGTLTAWRTILDSGNYSSYALPLSGGTLTGGLTLNYGDPTINFRDTDHNVGFIHVNSNLMYVLRGATNATTWTQVDGQWPYIFNLTNNDATCGRIHYAVNSHRSPIFYDSNDTGYYIDPNSTGPSALRMRGGALCGPNTTWGAYLYVGTNGNVDVNTATVAATNGNLHLDAANGYVMYLNNYATSSYTVVSQSCRSPIFYDLNNTGYYVDPNSTSNLVAWTTNGRNNSNEWIQFNNYSGLYSPLNGAHFYPNNVTYGSWRIDGSRNGWRGIHFDSGMTLMMNDNACGVHREGQGWRFYVESTNLYCNGQIQAYWSDRRLKENFRPIKSESLDILSKMTAYRFNWNKKVKELGLDIEVGKEEISLIAQDVQAILPDAVAVNKAGASPSAEEEFDYLTIKYDRITPIVVQAINELRERIEQLETV